MCVCIKERESERRKCGGNLSVPMCLCFEEGRSGEPLRGFHFSSLSSISTSSSSTAPYITHTLVYRSIRCTLPSLWTSRENPEPWGQIVAHISMLQNLLDSTDQHVAESIRQSFLSVS